MGAGYVSVALSIRPCDGPAPACAGHLALRCLDFPLRLAPERPSFLQALEYIATHRPQTTEEGVQADVAAAVAWLRANGCRSIFTLGFCFGGRASWLAAAAGHELAGAIGFYGRPPEGRASAMQAPILALQAGADAHILPEQNAAFEADLAAADVEHELVVFPGAPHSFFDRKHEEYAAASAEAWERVVAFLAAHS